MKGKIKSQKAKIKVVEGPPTRSGATVACRDYPALIFAAGFLFCLGSRRARRKQPQRGATASRMTGSMVTGGRLAWGPQTRRIVFRGTFARTVRPCPSSGPSHPPSSPAERKTGGDPRILRWLRKHRGLRSCVSIDAGLDSARDLVGRTAPVGGSEVAVQA